MKWLEIVQRFRYFVIQCVTVADMAKQGVTLVQTDFPLYTVRALGDRHFIIAGGGGQSKTGVENAIVSEKDIFCFG